MSKALEYGIRSLVIHRELNDRAGLAGDYTNIGVVLVNMGRLEEALDSHNKVLEIDKELNDRVGLAEDYYNFSFVLAKTNKKETLEYVVKPG